MTEQLSSEQIFIRKLTEIVLANLENENFGVNELVKASGMSQYKLSLKLRSINNKTINQFIREVRLVTAKKLLQTEEYSAAEVTYKVGFSSPAYFNTCFREYFGYPPGKVRKNGNEDSNEVPNSQINESLNSAQFLSGKFKALASFLILSMVVLATIYFINPDFFRRGILEKQRSSGEKVSIAVMPLQNVTNDTTLNLWQSVIQQNLISSLSSTGELKVRQKEFISSVINAHGVPEYAGVSPEMAGKISEKLKADIYIIGSIQKGAGMLRINMELVDTKTGEVIHSFNIKKPYSEEYAFQIIDTTTLRVRNFLLVSEIIRKENPSFQIYTYAFRSPEVLKYTFYGDKARSKADNVSARYWYQKALAIDSNSFDANLGLWQAAGTMEESLQILLRLYKRKDKMPLLDELYTNWAYAINFGPPGDAIKWLKLIQDIDDQNPNIPLLLGNAYKELGQYETAIASYKSGIERFLKLDIKDNYGYCLLGETYHALGKYEEERRLYRKAENNNPDRSTISFSWIIRNQASLSLIEGDTVMTNKYKAEFISILKRNLFSEADIADGLALMYKQGGEPDRAEEYYRISLSLEPDNPQRMDNLCTFLCESGRHLAEIPAIMTKAMDIGHDDYAYFKYSDTKAMGLYKLGYFNDALNLLQTIQDSAQIPLYSYKSHFIEVKKAISLKR